MKKIDFRVALPNLITILGLCLGLNSLKHAFEGDFEKSLIFVVLGSILMGVATVNQAGAIGAVGAGIMGSYRLYGDGKLKYVPAIVTIISLLVVTILVANFDLNIKTINTSSELTAVLCATLAVFFLILGIVWSFWRTF